MWVASNVPEHTEAELSARISLNSRNKVLVAMTGPRGAVAETVHLSRLTVVHRDPISTEESNGKSSSDGESIMVGIHESKPKS